MRPCRSGSYGHRMVRTITAAAAAILLLLVAAACGGTTPHRIPDVTGEKLNVAEDTLDGLGLAYRTLGGGAFGIIVRSNWVVCGQSPRPQRIAREVVLTVARTCTLPDTVGYSLEDGEDELSSAGVDYRVHGVDAGPVVDEDEFGICEQSPPAGADVHSVDLYVSTYC